MVDRILEAVSQADTDPVDPDFIRGALDHFVVIGRIGAWVALGLADRGFGWNVEMQVRAMEAGWKIVELPVTYHPRPSGESKISGSWAGTLRAGHGIMRMLALLWMLRWRRSEAGVAAGQQAPRNP